MERNYVICDDETRAYVGDWVEGHDTFNGYFSGRLRLVDSDAEFFAVCPGSDASSKVVIVKDSDLTILKCVCKTNSEFYADNQPVNKQANDAADMVSHPPHYQSKTGLEVIDVIEAFTSDLKGIEATDTGNVIKYICRWKHKNGIEDLKKAEWYLRHLINYIEKGND